MTWNGTSYSIPAAGEVNWAALSNFLIDLGNNAQTTNFQKFAVRKAVTSPVTVSATTDCVVVTDLTVAGAVTVNLPAGSNKQVFVIADGKGDAVTNNITINPAGADTIGGAASQVINTNRGSYILIYNSADTDWKIVSKTAIAAGIVTTDNAIARYDGTAGALQNSGVIIDDTNNITGVVNITPTGKVRLANGTAADPSLVFASDDDGTGTGVYRVSANVLGFTSNGVKSGQVSATGAWDLGSTGVGSLMHTLRSDTQTTLQVDANGATGGPALINDNAKTGAANYAALNLMTADAIRWAVLSGQTYTGTSNLAADEFGVVRSGAGGSVYAKIGTTGAITFQAIHNLALGNVNSGTATPGTTRQSGVTATFSNSNSVYSRVGDVVTVSGRVLVNNTSGGDGLLVFTVSLPIASNLTGGGDLSGVGVNSANGDTVITPAIVQADTTNDAAELRVIVKNGADNPMRYTYQYEVK